MNADIFAEWLRRQGHHVIHTKSSYWFNQGPRVYQAFPYHWLITPTAAELQQFLQKQRAIGLRYSTPVEASEGMISYHAVYERATYGFEDLGKWARKNVRRGLKNCRVEPVTWARLAEEGWRLQVDTLARQGRQLQIEKDAWRLRCETAASLPGFTAWGALVGDQLAASVITFQMDDTMYMLYQQCQREYLEAHVNNALGFAVTQMSLAQPGVKGILYGLHSLDAPPSVDEFKFRMGYTAKPVRQRVVWHTLAKPMFNSVSYAVVRQLRQWQPGNPTVAKMEGMFRFYQEGRRPLDQQPWPEILMRSAKVEEEPDA